MRETFSILHYQKSFIVIKLLGSPAKSSSASPARKSRKSGSHRGSRSSSNEPDFLFGSPAKRFPILSNPAFEEDEEEEEDDEEDGVYDKSRVALLEIDEESDQEVDNEEALAADEDNDGACEEPQVQEEQDIFDSDFDYYIRYGHDDVPIRQEIDLPVIITYNENAMLKT